MKGSRIYFKDNGQEIDMLDLKIGDKAYYQDEINGHLRGKSDVFIVMSEPYKNLDGVDCIEIRYEKESV